MVSDGTFKLLISLGMLLTGSLNTLSKKGQNARSSAGWNGDDHMFNHPWFQTVLMFIGEALCMFALAYQRNAAKKQALENDDSQAKEKPTRVFQSIFIIPTIMDLLGTTLGGIGLVYVSASIWQMLRGSIIIFTGILSWLFLKRKMLPYRWISIGVTAVGLVLVGVSGMLGSTTSMDTDAGSMIFGMMMVLSGQLVAAIQMVIEETFLKQRNFAAMHVVGMEGIFGLVFMLCVVLPFLFFLPGDQLSPLPYDVYENSFDAILQMVNSAPILIFGIIYLMSISFYNFFGLSVTKYMTCVHRTLIDACRTIVVWAVNLFCHYALGLVGEQWTVYSWVQVGGFLLLMTGTVLYNGIVHIPGLEYEGPSPLFGPKETDLEKQTLITKTSEEELSD